MKTKKFDFSITKKARIWLTLAGLTAGLAVAGTIAMIRLKLRKGDK